MCDKDQDPDSDKKDSWRPPPQEDTAPKTGQGLLFVPLAIGSGSSRLQRDSHGPNAQLVRAHVRKSSAAQQGTQTPQGLSEPFVQPPSYSTHLSKFRALPIPRREGVRRRDRAVLTSKPPSSLLHQQPRPLLPRPKQEDDEADSIPPIESPPLSLALNIPIDPSTPGTMRLLEYYHSTAYMSNSLAVNPEGKWMAVATASASLLHAMLCIVALHQHHAEGRPLAQSFFWHRGEAIQTISTQLALPDVALSDENIGAVALLAITETWVEWASPIKDSHMNGLMKMVRMRGGLDGLSTNRHVKRVVSWADLLYAIVNGQLPALDMAKCTAYRNLTPIRDLAANQGFSDIDKRTADRLPEELIPIFHDLQLLGFVKPYILKDIFPNMDVVRPCFSALLYKTERRILETAHSSHLNSGIAGIESDASAWIKLLLVEASKEALLIYSFRELRAMTFAAAFFNKLVGRLRNALQIAVNQSQRFVETQGQADFGQLHSDLLLWLCFMGWLACRTPRRGLHKAWFLSEAARVLDNAGVDSPEDLRDRLNGFLQFGMLDYMSFYFEARGVNDGLSE